MHHSNPPPTFLSHPPDLDSDPTSDPDSPLSPLQRPPPTTTTTTTTTTMSDIFSTTPSPPSSPTSHNPTNTNDEPSDVPRLRSTHATAGYRDGIAASKENTIQSGFDEGYALGATVAMRAGWVLGVLEGVRDALVAGERGGRGGDEVKGEAKRVERMVGEARWELSVQGLFGERYWGADGVWRFEVVGSGDGTRGGGMEGGEGEVTFLEVAEQHPVIREWVGVVEKEAERWGVDLRGFEGEEWERGRVGG